MEESYNTDHDIAEEWQAPLYSDRQRSGFASHAQALARASMLATSNSSPQSIERGIAEQAAALFAAARVSLFACTQEGTLQQIIAAGLPQYACAAIQNWSRAAHATRFLSRMTEPVVVGKSSSDLLLAGVGEDMASEGIATVVMVPVFREGTVQALLVLCHDKARDYSPSDLNVLQAMSGLLAPAVAGGQVAGQRGGTQLRDRFFSVLSHELRTPLTSIMGFTQLLRKRLGGAPGADPRVLNQLDVIWVQAQRLSRLVDTFVDISHIESGQFAIKHGRVDLISTLKVAVEQASNQVANRLTIDLALPSRPVWLHGDQKRLEQLFSHLLSNAMRYSPTEKPVHVVCEDRVLERTVFISVTDFGPGIPAGRLKDVFEKFQPDDPVGAGGLGVGLYLSKTIVEAHGGHISLESSHSEGTTVCVTLPV